MQHERVVRQIVAAAFAVQGTLGPGVLQVVIGDVRSVSRRHVRQPFFGRSGPRQIGLPVQFRQDRIDPGMDGILVSRDAPGNAEGEDRPG